MNSQSKLNVLDDRIADKQMQGESPGGWATRHCAMVAMITGLGTERIAVMR